MKGQGKYPRRTLAAVKSANKRMSGLAFTPHRKNRFPAPWQHVSQARRLSTGLIQVDDDLHIGFIARGGLHYEERAMYGCLFKGTPPNPLVPLLRLDWHPSHKGLHVVINCEDDRNLRGRNLSGKEFDLSGYGVSFLDPEVEQDRLKFVEIFCSVCNIAIGDEGLFS